MALKDPGIAQTSRETNLERLLSRLKPRFLAIANGYGILHQDAEDLVQQTLLAFIHKQSGIRSPEVWLVGAFKKQCLLYLRTRRRQLYEAMDESLLEFVSKPEACGQEQVAVRRDLSRAISRISERCRSVLQLRYRLGYEPAELAQRLGYRTSSVRKVTSRCLAALTKEVVAPSCARGGSHA